LLYINLKKKRQYIGENDNYLKKCKEMADTSNFNMSPPSHRCSGNQPGKALSSSTSGFQGHFEAFHPDQSEDREKWSSSTRTFL
jgi:hypothetical protein